MKRKVFLTMKISNIQSRHICDFSKGVNQWFKLNNWNLTFVCFLLPIFSEGGGTSVNRLTDGLSWKIDTDHTTTPIITLTTLPRLPYYWLQSTTVTTLTTFTTLTLLTTSISFTALTTAQHRLHWLKSSYAMAHQYSLRIKWDSLNCFY